MTRAFETIAARPALTEPLHRVLGWMLSHRDGDGAIVCPFHRIEHTGKSAGAAVLACTLARHDPEADHEALLEVARQQARRMVARLEREGESTCFTFRPGRHDPYNCSNSVIDGGACSDALAEVVQTFGDRLESEEREAFVRASVLGAQTYLRYCVLDKGIPAQKAWALTGVAQAHALSGHEVLELTVREGATILDALTRADGSVPYPPVEGGAGHPGASDASAFYQSRVTAFLAFALERAGLDPVAGPWRGQLERGLDFLYICYDNEGYGNTGQQYADATPHGAMTSTSTGPGGHPGYKKDLFSIWTAHKPAYVATVIGAEPLDLARKIEKARDIKGPRMIISLSPCPTGWDFDPSLTAEVGKLAVRSGIWPLKEYENGNPYILLEQRSMPGAGPAGPPKPPSPRMNAAMRVV